MPIYAYRCSACGHEQDVLRKVSDPLLTTCPECGRETYEKQVTAAGFRLKGTGWYETDFRGGGRPSVDKGPADKGSAEKPANTASDAALSSSTPTSPG